VSTSLIEPALSLLTDGTEILEAIIVDNINPQNMLCYPCLADMDRINPIIDMAVKLSEEELIEPIDDYVLVALERRQVVAIRLPNNKILILVICRRKNVEMIIKGISRVLRELIEVAQEKEYDNELL